MNLNILILDKILEDEKRQKEQETEELKRAKKILIELVGNLDCPTCGREFNLIERAWFDGSTNVLSCYKCHRGVRIKIDGRDIKVTSHDYLKEDVR